MFCEKDGGFTKTYTNGRCQGYDDGTGLDGVSIKLYSVTGGSTEKTMYK